MDDDVAWPMKMGRFLVLCLSGNNFFWVHFKALDKSYPVMVICAKCGKMREMRIAEAKGSLLLFSGRV